MNYFQSKTLKNKAQKTICNAQILITITILALTFGLLSLYSSAQICFDLDSNYSVGAYPRCVDINDFNGDSIPDMVTANHIPSTISVRLGLGAGVFDTVTHYTVGANAPRYVISADLNGDSIPDIAVANYYSTFVYVLIGDGNGNFGAATNYSVGSDPTSIAVADYNSDGYADLAVTNSDNNNVSILLNDSAGGFGTKTNYAASTYPTSILTEDFNDDGFPDLAVANYSAARVSVLLSDSVSGFGTKTDFTVGSNPYCVTHADFNGDGIVDLATSNYGSNNVSVLIGNGSGGFNSAVNFAAGSQPISVSSADYNGDGNADISVANYNGNTATVLFGDGTGDFLDNASFAAGTAPRSVASADLNGDGTPDLAVANQTTNDVTILLNEMKRSSQTLVVCTGQSVTVGSSTYTTSGIYLDILTSSLGCDSIVTTDLTVNPLPSVIANATTNNVCEGYSVTLTGSGASTYVWSQGVSDGVSFIPYVDTTYLVMGTDTNGCSDMDMVSVSIIYPVTSNQTLTICLGDSVTIGSNTYNTTGTYSDVLTSSFGCDSTVTTNLKVIFGNDSAIFAPDTTFKAGYQISSFASYDFNGDGNLDMAITSSGSNKVSISLGDGAGNFGTAIYYGTGSAPYSVAIADFNGDTFADMVVANMNSNSASVFLGDSIGDFGSGTGFSTGTKPSSVVCADFNSDGNADFAVANYYDANVSLFLGNGAGGFAPRTNFGIGSYPLTIVCKDFNNDGNADIASANWGSSNVSVLLGNGAGNFAAAANFTVGSDPYSICSGDFNGDGNADLATPNPGSGDISVLLGNGTGGFGTSVEYIVGGIWFPSSPRSITSADFNGDGNADLAIGEGGIFVLLGDGIGSFAPFNSYVVPGSHYSIMSADLNNDGKPDIALPSSPDSAYAILLNLTIMRSEQTLTVCAGDSLAVGSSTYDSTGIYIDVLQTVEGCDSTVTTNLTVDPEITGSQTLTICAEDSVVVGTSIYDSTGVYIDVFTASNGCDSTFTTTLTVDPAIVGSQTLTTCAEDSVVVGTSVYNSTGIYTDVFTASNGCDSTFTTNLTVDPVIVGSQTLTICAEDSVVVGTNVYNSTGIYTDVFTASNECDSTFTTNLTVDPAITGSQTLTICADDSVVVGTSVYYSTGVYTDILTASNGCDSIFSTTLTVNSTYGITDNAIAICNGDSISIYGTFRSVAGTYYDSLTAVNGCDSVHSTVLSVDPLPATPIITPTAPTSFCQGENVILFTNSTSGNLWSTGETTQFITVSTSGSYSVTLTDPNGCSAVSVPTSVTAYPTPTVYLGADTIICYGCSITLDAGTGFACYLWSTGEITQTINVVSTDTYIVQVTDANGCAAADTIVIDIASGINQQLPVNDYQLQVHPNPNTGEFTITFNIPEKQDILINVINIKGQLIYEENLSKYSGTYQKTIDVGTQAAGIYTLRLISDEGMINKKIIILE
ncbi:MAG: T9SS type A sorting domain-containing protein [Bacteroidota bacterium]